MKLIFRGIVQGVGFRPVIYNVAKKLGACGYVLNKGSEVEVVIDIDPNVFITEVKKQLPSLAKITEIDVKDEESTHSFDDFKILHSANGERHSLIPPDTATCDKCLKELFDKSDRRYHFPFTNCTVCGARFSLIIDVPYDRERTSMKSFPLCSSCNQEYQDPLNRRYHAQTISCPQCGPRYTLYDHNGRNIGSDHAIQRFAKALDEGKIGVVKSWGGMHLCCRVDKIQQFRKWYKRPQKSFAIMVKNFETAEEYGEISKDEKELLLSRQRPIVLVKKKKAEEVSPGLNTIGLFLPYTGLHHLLFSFLETDALIMTSANIPGEPMITDNKEVFSLRADMYLLHNRNIPNRVDDSVIKLWKNQKFFLRKSRGYVPEPLQISYPYQVLSVGAGENVCGAISVDNKLFMTQYIGNSRYYPTLQFLEESLRHMMHLTMTKETLDAVTMDLHPGYETRSVAKQFAEEFSTSLFEVQHHWAHAASLLVDTNIDEAVVLTLDGLGYGEDGAFWGGEILFCNFLEYKRIGHLQYIPLLGGDKATYDPRRLVFAIFHMFGEEKFFSGREAEILKKQMKTSPQSSSFGRVLDALSCCLNICMKRTYDGEPAMKLERYLAQGKPEYEFNVNIKNGVVETVDLFKQLQTVIQHPVTEKQKMNLCFSFVKSIVDSFCDIAISYANEHDVPCIGVTGGVSYNIPITEMIAKKVNENGLKLLVHNRVPNGDGGIAVGQNAIIGYKLNTE